MSDLENPFQIAVPDSELEFLRSKLALTRFPTSDLEGAGWQSGAPIDAVRRLFVHWKDSFDWKKHEAKLNQELPQFTRDIGVEGHGRLNIHYVYQKSVVTGAIPLLFLHGWPGSFIEARKIIPFLTAASPDHPSFHVVAMSLPGFGFSEAPRQKGFGTTQYAELANKLMLALGYNEYVTHCGDLGFLVGRSIASIYGGVSNKAWHTNTPFPAPTPDEIPNLRVTAAEGANMARNAEFFKTGNGYMQMQSTRPQTLAYGITDSPLGLLGWIYDMLVQASDDYPWTDDEVVEWISIYWFSRAGPAASFNIYYEFTQASAFTTPPPKSPIPLGFSRFANEVIVFPKSWNDTVGNVVFDKVHDKGGHFAAHEKPEELVADIREMFGRGGAAFGVVGGKDGYA